MSDDVERWIADMFSGHAVAIRRQDDPPIPGEPFMSMAAAKDICRAALTASRSSNDEIVEVLEEVLAIPAVRAVLGTRHTSDCNCPCCRARALLSKVKEQG